MCYYFERGDYTRRQMARAGLGELSLCGCVWLSLCCYRRKSTASKGRSGGAYPDRGLHPRYIPRPPSTGAMLVAGDGRRASHRDECQTSRRGQLRRGIKMDEMAISCWKCTELMGWYGCAGPKQRGASFPVAIAFSPIEISQERCEARGC